MGDNKYYVGGNNPAYGLPSQAEWVRCHNFLFNGTFFDLMFIYPKLLDLMYITFES